MLYLLLAFLLMATGIGLYLNSVRKKELLPRSSKVTFSIFFILGAAMTVFALQEIDSDQYKNIDTFTKEYPDLQATVDQRMPHIKMYEYLEILEAYKALQKENLD